MNNSRVVLMALFLLGAEVVHTLPVRALSVSFDHQEETETLLLRTPAVSNTHIAFVFGGDIWVANRDGSYPVDSP